MALHECHHTHTQWSAMFNGIIGGWPACACVGVLHAANEVFADSAR